MIDNTILLIDEKFEDGAKLLDWVRVGVDQLSDGSWQIVYYPMVPGGAGGLRNLTMRLRSNGLTREQAEDGARKLGEALLSISRASLANWNADKATRNE